MLSGGRAGTREGSKTLVYLKPTSNFGPPLINFFFFSEDKFSNVCWGGGRSGGGAQAAIPPVTASVDLLMNPDLNARPCPNRGTARTTHRGGQWVDPHRKCLQLRFPTRDSASRPKPAREKVPCYPQPKQRTVEVSAAPHRHRTTNGPGAMKTMAAGAVGAHCGLRRGKSDLFWAPCTRMILFALCRMYTPSGATCSGRVLHLCRVVLSTCPCLTQNSARNSCTKCTTP